MATVRVFVGIDYHDQSLQVCVLDREGRILCNCECVNDAAQLNALVRRFGNEISAAIECCCGASNLADALTVHFQWMVTMGHAGYVRRMKQNPDKSDFTDARMLADLERVGYLPKVWRAPEEIRNLREVVRYRQQLAQQRRATKLRMRALLRDHRQKPPAAIKPWTVKWHQWLIAVAQLPDAGRWVMQRYLEELQELARKIKVAETELCRMTADDPLVNYLAELRGFGRLTAIIVRAELGRFDRFRTGKQMARFCGLSPCNASSGAKQADAGLIRASNPQLRTTLIELAHRLARLQPRWQQFKAKLMARGKRGSVASAAVANRFVRWLYHQYQPHCLAA